MQPEEVEGLLKAALKNIEYAHRDELLAIEEEMRTRATEDQSAKDAIATLQQQLLP